MARMVDWINEYALWLYLLCVLGLLACVRSIMVTRREKKRTIFKLEREMAAVRESRAISMSFLLVGVMIAITAVKFYVTPAIRALPPTATPTPTNFIFQEPPTRTVPTATPTVPEPTATRRPTYTPSPTVLPTATPVSQVRCPDSGVCISYPLANMRLAGVVEIKGTAAIDRFQFYKIEYGLGEKPQEWHSIGDVQKQPVVNGTLGLWNTSGFPPGVYRLRLTVVDITGNFPPPYEVQVIIGQ